MYGKTSKSSHYIKRTGSYSTVPHAGGRVDVLPPSAKDMVFEQFLERRDAILRRIGELDERIEAMNREWEGGMMMRKHQWSTSVQLAKVRGERVPNCPPAILEFDRTRKALGDEKKRLQNDLSILNGASKIKEIRKKEWHELFVHLAELMLDDSTFARIRDETRRRIELAKTQGQ